MMRKSPGTAKSRRKPPAPAVAPARAAAPLTAAARKARLKESADIDRRGRKPPAQDYPISKKRKQLKGISIYMHPLAKEVLDKISHETKLSVQDLGLEALNLLFRHYGEKPIA